jgi:hypothetical protein
MGLTRAALIFAAGYVLGRPEGRAKVTQLAQRPEVTQLREQAANTASSGWQSGKEQLTQAARRANKQTDQAPSTSNGSGPDYSERRRRRLPSFPRRGARPAPGVATTAPVGTAPTAPTSGGTSTVPVAGAGASTDTTSTGTEHTTATPASPMDSGSTPPTSTSAEPGVPPVASTAPIPPTGAE